MYLKFILFIWIAIPLFVFPQAADSVIISGNYSVKIDSIRVKGNKVTKDYIILRELTFHNGDSLNTGKADFNKDRIYSLGLFTSVDVFPVKYKDYTCAFISVEESWYIYPVPFVELVDRDWKKISFGLDVQLQNFMGRNQTLRTRIALGYDPAYYVYYSNPVINREYNLYLNSQIYYGKVNNKSIEAQILAKKDFSQKTSGGQIELGKRLTLYQYVSSTFGFSYVETPFYFKGISASDSRIDRVFFTGLGYIFDTRDLAQFPKTGVYGTGSVIFKGLGIDKINYQILSLDFRTYKELLTDFYAKIRFASRNTFGESVPYYDYSFLGYGERVRGNSNHIKEGLDSYLFSAEVFTPIVKDIKVNLYWIPLIPKSLLTYRVALYTDVFGDAGTTRRKGQQLSINNTDTGYGLGLTVLILPYYIVRVEYAFNQYRNTEVLVDLGISF